MRKEVKICFNGSIVWKYVFLSHILDSKKNIINDLFGTISENHKFFPADLIAKISFHKTQKNANPQNQTPAKI